jgi:hypothetical protein
MSGFKQHYNLRETKIETKVKEYAEKKGWLVRKYKSPGQRFVPDRIFFGPGGWIFFIEFKAPGKKPNKGQAEEHQKLRDRGFDVFVVDNIGDGYIIVDQYSLGLYKKGGK